MKIMKIMLAIALSAAAINVSAFPYHGGDHDNYRGGYHNDYHGHDDYHGGNRGRGFGILPWVVGGAILYGATQYNRPQYYQQPSVVYQNSPPIIYQNSPQVEEIDGRMYRHVPNYCTDSYGQQVICGWQWVQY